MARRFELSETDLPTLNQVQWFIAAFTKAKLHRNDDYHGILGQIDALAYGPETNDTQPFSFAWQRTAQEKPDVGNGSGKAPTILTFPPTPDALRIFLVVPGTPPQTWLGSS
ncbi:hypothetical protein PF005_g2518 [Phytophthora fragariae]|uniref:Uncharacterized protein n=1 Tax=Phytophthora fragariae TaxID=53985 RepID=A0A6A3ZCR7_9STRA|nr:hypothetical protein PF007_g2459 [Phytophthora fragariae]KAE9232953.1 hypothetical protein PF005_g2518 [Phytophthora fragariae]KAE9239873.1 hypothetical protein PF004_g7753 [Phytophthora fragariae]